MKKIRACQLVQALIYIRWGVNIYITLGPLIWLPDSLRMAAAADM